MIQTGFTTSFHSSRAGSRCGDKRGRALDENPESGELPSSELGPSEPVPFRDQIPNPNGQASLPSLWFTQ